MRAMIHRIALFLSTLTATLAALLGPLLAGPALAQEAAAATAAAGSAAAAVKPALWKVSDEDTTIYLFGTIHALPPGVTWLGGPVEAALASSDQLVTEIPDTPAAEMQAAVLSNAVLPASESLRPLLPEDTRKAYEATMAGLGLPIDAFDRFEPWYAAIALSTLPLAKEGYSAANGVEETVAEAAKRLGKPRMGLETAAYQLAMFDGLPRDVQVRYLAEVIKGLPTINEDLGAIVREWSAGNAQKLAELLNADEDDPRMVAALLTGRNRMWADWIRARMKRPGTVFMAVGAGHLAGKDSVQDLLQKAGIAASRVQ